MRTVILGTWLALVSGLPAAAATWEEQAFLDRGDGPSEVGVSPPRVEELRWGPYGLAAGPDGAIAVIDRVNRRLLVLDGAGQVAATISVAGRPAAAVLLPGGGAAVADERDERTVRVVGVARETWSAPAWALPPVRLIAWDDGDGAVTVAGLDAFQNRLPLGPGGAARPAPLPRGLPGGGGGDGVWAVCRGDEGVLGFGDDEVALPAEAWPAPAGRPWRPGSVTVLAASERDAVLALESVSTDAGPLAVARAVVRVDRGGRLLDALDTPPAGSLAIPADLAASPDGTVWLLHAGDDGFALLRAALEGGR